MGRIKTTSETIYDNCQVYSSENVLISYTSKKKALKLLRWERAEIFSEEPFIIKMKKNLKSPLPINVLVPRENICVCCGTDKNLTRHHVIPHEYSKFMNVKFKKYNYGNVLAACYQCHQNYEREAYKLKLQLAERYNAPFVDRNSISTYALCYTILNSENIPYQKILELYDKLSKITNLPRIELTEEFMINKLEETHRTNLKSHSEIVWESIKDSAEDFIIMWKNHFLEFAKPNFLPEFWHYYLDKVDY